MQAQYLLGLAGWVQAILLVVAGVIAFQQWRDQSGLARRSQTFDYIAQAQRDREIIEAFNTKRRVAAVALSLDRNICRYFLDVYLGKAHPDREDAWGEDGADKWSGKAASGEQEQSPDASDGSKISEKPDGGKQVVVGKGRARPGGVDADVMSPRDALYVILNHYEVLGLGVHRGALDGDMLKGWWLTTYVEDYWDLQGVIREIRHEAENERIFKQFERLAAAWCKDLPDPVMKDRPNGSA